MASISWKTFEEQFVILGDSMLIPNNYSAIQYVQSMSQVSSNQATSFIGGAYVVMNPGFESEEGAVFIAAIDTCSSTTANGSRIAARMARGRLKGQINQKNDDGTANADNEIVDVTFLYLAKQM
ncbi:MAG: hypothetical protein IPH94_19155 [Saprospiraceae bacterium]|nr:hypothetical protein [Saprospiraceae bacterium]